MLKDHDYDLLQVCQDLVQPGWQEEAQAHKAAGEGQSHCTATSCWTPATSGTLSNNQIQRQSQGWPRIHTRWTEGSLSSGANIFYCYCSQTLISFLWDCSEIVVPHSASFHRYQSSVRDYILVDHSQSSGRPTYFVSFRVTYSLFILWKRLIHLHILMHLLGIM